LAVDHGLASIAFPSISTGIYGYPIELAAPVAVTAAREFLAHDSSLHEVIFCCYSPGDLALYERVLAGASA
ncbi:MAG: O-acetyl-ADP-ribose deacetylase, partial [Candidatus Rokuibacteriota bacterium]